MQSKNSRTACVAVLALHQAVTPLCATSFVPTLPLLLTHTLHEPVEAVGRLYAVFSVACLVGMLASAALLRRFSPRSALLIVMGCRIAAGAMHAAACAEATAATLPLLHLSRVLHGLSQCTMVLAPVWVGARVAPGERPRLIGLLSVAQTPGMVVGPSLGSLLAATLSSPLAQASAPGWITLALGLLALLATLALFDDACLLPQPSAAEHASADPLLVGLVAWYMFASTLGLLAFESILALALYDMYAIDGGAAIVVWAPLALSATLGGLLMTYAQERVNLATLALLWNAGFAGCVALAIAWSA